MPRRATAAEHLRPGDFTLLDGFRPLARVQLQPRKRTVLVRTSERAHKLAYGQLVDVLTLTPKGRQ